MIILDTNVVSELVRGPQASPHVLRWIRGLQEQPVTTVFNRSELLAGVALMPSGRRRDALSEVVTRVLADLSICLPFTDDGPSAYAEVLAVRRTQGRPIGTMDALIAAVALGAGAAIASRDVSGFSGLGLRLIDPWQAA